MHASTSLAACVALPLVVGLASASSSTSASVAWYDALRKPAWTPPKWAYAPVWTALYALMGLAAWRVLRAGGGPCPLALYGVQLALNAAWTPLFFGARDLDLASWDAVALVGATLGTALAFHAADGPAGWLMAPVVAWVALAAALTLSVAPSPAQPPPPPQKKPTQPRQQQQLRRPPPPPPPPPKIL